MSDQCPLCATEPEDTFHAFCRCPRAVELWRVMTKQWRIPAATSFRRTGTEWLAQTLCDLPDTERMELMMTLWRCWHVRNEMTHDKRPPPVEVSKRFLLSYVDSLIGTQNHPSADPVKGKQVVDAVVPCMPISHVQTTCVDGPRPRWVPPQAGWTKLNVDGSYCASSGTAGAGMILRDSAGEIIFSSCRELRTCAEPLEAELHACMEGLNLALQWTQSPIAIETDCLVALNMIKTPDRDRSRHAMLVEQINRLLREGRAIKLAHVRR